MGPSLSLPQGSERFSDDLAHQRPENSRPIGRLPLAGEVVALIRRMAVENPLWSRRRTFNVLYVFFVLSLDRRRILHIHVTAHPYAEWAAQQVVEAVGFDSSMTRLIWSSGRLVGLVAIGRPCVASALLVSQVRCSCRNRAAPPIQKRTQNSVRKSLAVLWPSHVAPVRITFATMSGSRTRAGLPKRR
jgi:hypothetical protein